MHEITITIGGISIQATLNDSALASQLVENLPVDVEMSRWGDEYYGACGMKGTGDTDMAGAREIMEVGEIAYWPTGDALCLFFGQTPASTDQRPRAVSPVVPLGKITESPEALKTLGTIETARIAPA